jgi:hypothetical protein
MLDGMRQGMLDVSTDYATLAQVMSTLLNSPTLGLISPLIPPAVTTLMDPTLQDLAGGVRDTVQESVEDELLLPLKDVWDTLSKEDKQKAIDLMKKMMEQMMANMKKAEDPKKP